MRLMVLSLLGLSLAGVSAWAQDPVLEALGGANLVLEEESTVLNLFNLGNPAGTAFLPQKNRLDLTFSLIPRQRQAEFTTGLTGTAAVIDALGNTLPPSTLFTRQNQSWQAGLDALQPQGYGGALLALNEAVTLQLVPRGSWLNRVSSDDRTAFQNQTGGLAVRSSWLFAPNASLGAGVSTGFSKTSGWDEPDWVSQQDLNVPLIFTEYQRREQAYGLELGTAYRLDGLFETKDALNLGLALKGERRDDTETFFLSGSTPVAAQFQGRTLPWQAQFQGIYSYLSSMDIALEAGYANQQWFDSLAADNLPGEAYHLNRNLDNLDYQLSLRVRLPMVRDDDLRFGVIFNNRGFEHPYPTGRLLSYTSDGVYAQPMIETVSSAIGIGTAFVPAEGSIVAFQYDLGSSKSRQDTAIIANSGFTRFSFGVQYALIEALVLRLGFASQRVVYEYDSADINPNTQKPYVLTRSVETSGVRFGLGLNLGPATLDLSVKGERILHSPAGWAMLDKPAAADSAGQDKDENLTTLLGLTWKF